MKARDGRLRVVTLDRGSWGADPVASCSRHEPRQVAMVKQRVTALARLP